MRPKVSIVAMNGLLGLQEPSEFGTCAVLIACAEAPVAGYGVPFMVRNKSQVTAAFIQAGNEPVIDAINNGYYAETAEGNKLYIIAMAATTTLTNLLEETVANLPLNLANGDVRLIAVIKFPSDTYVPTITSGFDDDVHTAVIAGQALSAIWFGKKKPFRFLVEGYGFVNSTDALDYSETANRNGGIIVGNIDDKTALPTMLALGRASRSQPQQNIGRIKTGSLVIAQDAVVKIGSVLAEQMTTADLEELHAKRYIAFERNETGSGFVFNDDNMLTTVADDYNNLRYGRVIDNAARIAYKTYYSQLKDDVDVDGNGRISKVIEMALQAAIETDIDEAMRPQLSKKADGTADVVCLVNPDPARYAALYTANDIIDPNFNIIQTNKVYLFILMRPKGCLKYLDVFLGLTAKSL